MLSLKSHTSALPARLQCNVIPQCDDVKPYSQQHTEPQPNSAVKPVTRAWE